jgi:hypothetical protein
MARHSRSLPPGQRGGTDTAWRRGSSAGGGCPRGAMASRRGSAETPGSHRRMAEHGGSLLPDGRWGPAARGSAEDLCRFHLNPRVPVGCGVARADLARCPRASDPPPRYTDCVDASSIRRFVDRPWGLLRAAKRRYWAEEVVARGDDAPLRASRMLWLHMRGLRPDWPSDAERAADLAHHLELKGCLDRAARALARLPDR